MVPKRANGGPNGTKREPTGAKKEPQIVDQTNNKFHRRNDLTPKAEQIEELRKQNHQEGNNSHISFDLLQIMTCCWKSTYLQNC